jgi:hypothetical protein
MDGLAVVKSTRRNVYQPSNSSTEIIMLTRNVKVRKKKPANTCPTEEQEQIVFVTWLLKQGYKVSGSANGGSRHILEAVKLKRMGVSPGYPDVFVPLKTPKFSGFYVEMKRLTGGKIQQNQIEWLEYLRGQGYYAEVAKGAEEAKKMFHFYVSTIPGAA